ncbi:hypothetical protein [Chromobacterium vaccinii]|uniref:hypothetical protein n=1 Tax=Chromobacterium vaccinii TaxID=1108595 RepID=UPI001184EDAD|nr:hypothetical protein [Chromobacterium vaccinii]
MKKHESVYNIYAFFEAEQLRAMGIKKYYRQGSDQKKLDFLRERAMLDFSSVQRVPLAQPISKGEYYSRERLGNTPEIFEPLFASVNAGQTPLYCVTHIVDGVPVVDQVIPLGPLDVSELPDGMGRAERMDDYLFKYLDKETGKFDMTALINDDYFEAMRLLFNSRHFISCFKLLVSFLDTVAYVEFGDRPPRTTPVFIDWIRAFSTAGIAGATPEELWELRNSLLHMSNLESRKVAERKIVRLLPYVASKDRAPSTDPMTKYINFKNVIEDVGEAVAKWIATYNEHPEKLNTFILRYDLVVSDDRWATITNTLAEQ